MQINVKEHTKESLLKQKLKQLEKKLLTTQKELQRESEYNTHLESIIKGDSVKKSTTITIKSATKIEFVPVNDIICCNADEGYTDVLLIDGRIITAAKPLTIFENILENNSRNEDVLFNMACALIHLKQFHKANVLFDNILRIKPTV